MAGLRATVRKWPKRLLRRSAPLLALVGAAALPSPVAARHHGPPSTGLSGVAFAKPPPDFRFDLGRGPQTLAALRGKPVIINFWATWCEPCRDELGTFEKLDADYGKAIDLLTITDETPGTARAFLQQRGLDLPVIADPERKIFNAYTITPIPVTIVVAPDGTVSYVSIGEMTYQELKAAVAAAVAQPPPASSTPSPPTPTP